MVHYIQKTHTKNILITILSVVCIAKNENNMKIYTIKFQYKFQYKYNKKISHLCYIKNYYIILKYSP